MTPEALAEMLLYRDEGDINHEWWPRGFIAGRIGPKSAPRTSTKIRMTIIGSP